MKKMIDCLIIGHNEMEFSEYEKMVRSMGQESEAYQDLNLNFIKYNNKLLLTTDAFNTFFDKSKVGFDDLTLGEAFSPTISYLGTYLSRRGFSFDYVPLFKQQKDQLIEKLKNNEILTIAITTTFYISVYPILEIVSLIKKYNKAAKIILGGPFIATNVLNQDEFTIQYIFDSIGADFYVNSSQGEAALVNIIKSLKSNTLFNQIKNIYYRQGEAFIATPIERENNILEDNFVDWNLFKDRLGHFAKLRSAISCPFMCSFCGFPQHAGKYQTMSIQAIEKELNMLSEIGKTKSLAFIDDTFNIPQDRFKEILRMMLKNKYNFKWYSYYRCQYADRETIELMKECGCEAVFLGIESGNQIILNNMNKAADVEKYKKGIELLKEYGIFTLASFITGFPGETIKTAQDTINFIEETAPDFYRAQLWYCEPITPIWKHRDKYGIKGSQFKWEHESMNSKQAAQIVNEMFLNIKNSIFLNGYFDITGVCHMLHRGLSIEQVKKFIIAFNQGVQQKIMNPNNDEISIEIANQMKKAVELLS